MAGVLPDRKFSIFLTNRQMEELLQLAKKSWDSMKKASKCISISTQTKSKISGLK
jgi:hypothetical protein